MKRLIKPTQEPIQEEPMSNGRAKIGELQDLKLNQLAQLAMMLIMDIRLKLKALLTENIKLPEGEIMNQGLLAELREMRLNPMATIMIMILPPEPIQRELMKATLTQEEMSQGMRTRNAHQMIETLMLVIRLLRKPKPIQQAMPTIGDLILAELTIGTVNQAEQLNGTVNPAEPMKEMVSQASTLEESEEKRQNPPTPLGMTIATRLPEMRAAGIPEGRRLSLSTPLVMKDTDYS